MSSADSPPLDFIRVQMARSVLFIESMTGSSMEKRHTLYRFAYAFLIILFLMFLLLPKRGFSANDSFTTESGSRSAEILLDYAKGKIEAKVIDRKNLDLPNSIQISLFGKGGKRTDLELVAVESTVPSDDPKYKRDYRGILPANQKSFVGVALKIPLK